MTLSFSCILTSVPKLFQILEEEEEGGSTGTQDWESSKGKEIENSLVIDPDTGDHVAKQISDISSYDKGKILSNGIVLKIINDIFIWYALY